MERLTDEPLEIGYTESSEQKYIYFPQKSTDKPFSQVEPGQKVLPLVLDKRYGENQLPTDLELQELLQQGIKLTKLIEAKIYEADRQEEMEEGIQAAIETLKEFERQIQQEYVADEENEPSFIELVKTRVEGEYRPQIEEKFEDIREWKQEQIWERIYDEIEQVEDIEPKGHNAVFKTEDNSYEVQLDEEAIDITQTDYIRKAAEEYVQILEEVQKKQRNFIENLGLDHYSTNTNLGFFTFRYIEGGQKALIEIPMALTESNDIDVYASKT